MAKSCVVGGVNKLLAISFGILILSCGKDEVTLTDTDTQITAWLDTAGITNATRDNNGIYYYSEIENASGSSISTSNVVAIYYNLYDLDGNIVATHQNTDGDSLIFKHGVLATYPLGLDAGVGYMRVGETYSFLLPPSQAYADLTSGAIVANRVYRLQVEVVGVFDENDLFTQELTDIDNYITDNALNDTDVNPLDSVEQFSSGVTYKRLSAGTGNLPLNGDTIQVNYTGTYLDGSGNFDSKSGFQWSFGSNQPRPLAPGFEFGVSLMQNNENALLLIPSSQAYRESALVVPAFIADDLVEDAIIPEYASKVTPYKTLIFDIRRVN